MHIPPNLLAEGLYSVRIAIFTSSNAATEGIKHNYVQYPDAISFQVYDPMAGLSARGDYAQNFPGVMRPLLKWSISHDRAGSAHPSTEVKP